mmetsp:Transcript_25106/g.64138  ORF Transcript_25106/g.64138 Transcript_25106/m.64138 type:complete len:782 (-) Transcript_25106:185-2530(-)
MAADKADPRHSVKDDQYKPGPQSPLQKKVADFIESPRVEKTIIFLVALYCGLIFIDVVGTGPESKFTLSDGAQEVMAIVDLGILTLFFFEIVAKIFAFGYLLYLTQPLYFADAVIVVVSIAMSIVELLVQDSVLQRLSRIRAVLRSLRIVIMFRKISNVTDYVAESKLTGLGYNLGAPAETVISILKPLCDYPRLPARQREDIKWAISIIDSGKLNEPIHLVDDDAPVDDAVNHWIINASQGAHQQHAASQKAQGEESEASPSRERRGSNHIGAAAAVVLGNTLNQAKGAAATVKSVVDTVGSRGKAKVVHMDEEHTLEAGTADAAKEARICLSELGLDIDTALVYDALQTSSKWDFDTARLHALAKGNGLRVGVPYVMTRWSLLSELKLDSAALSNWIDKVQSGYHAKNPFHNAMHATDVFFGVSWMTTVGGARQIAHLEDAHFCGVLLAAAVHDFEHPAVNNAFLVNTRHKFAIKYNDKAVLEMHHVASAFALLHEFPDCDFFRTAVDGCYWTIREVMISAILATDISQHFAELGKLKSRLSSGNFLKAGEASLQSDRLLLLDVIVHSADISNPAKNFHTYLFWTSRVITEFFAQGDREKELGLPVSMFMDRETTNIAKCQIGFIDILVLPLFEVLTEVLPRLSIGTVNCKRNKMIWGRLSDQMETEMVEKTQRMPDIKAGDPLLTCEDLPTPREPSESGKSSRRGSEDGGEKKPRPRRMSWHGIHVRPHGGSSIDDISNLSEPDSRQSMRRCTSATSAAVTVVERPRVSNLTGLQSSP